MKVVTIILMLKKSDTLIAISNEKKLSNKLVRFATDKQKFLACIGALLELKNSAYFVA